MSVNVTRREMQLALAYVRTIHELMMECGPEGVPSGHIYAHLMGKMDLQTYERLLGMCIRVEICELKNDVLRPGKAVRDLKEANDSHAKNQARA